MDILKWLLKVSLLLALLLLGLRADPKVDPDDAEKSARIAIYSVLAK